MSSTTKEVVTKDRGKDISIPIEVWLGYCHFHHGDYEKALKYYQDAYTQNQTDQLLPLNIACCNIFLGDNAEAAKYAAKGKTCQLKERIQFFLAYKSNPETFSPYPITRGTDTVIEQIQNQMCHAAVLFLQERYSKACDIYEQLAKNHPEYPALHVYVAACKLKLACNMDAGTEIRQYLMTDSHSAVANNIHASIVATDYPDSDKPLQILKEIEKEPFVPKSMRAIIRHNTVVFKKGEGALQVLPQLVDELREARANLALFHINADQTADAYALFQGRNPQSLQESMVKAVVCTIVGQDQLASPNIDATGEYPDGEFPSNNPMDNENIQIAARLFEVVGKDEDAMDTVTGRQAYASAHILQGRHAESLRYLQSIEHIYPQDTTFNYNYGLALAKSQKYHQAEEHLVQVQLAQLKPQEQAAYIEWRLRSHIMSGHPDQAWELFRLRKQASGAAMFGDGMDAGTAEDAETTATERLIRQLQIISTDCYDTGNFYYAAKAFDLMENTYNESMPLTESTANQCAEGRRASVAGFFMRFVQKGKDVSMEMKQQMGELLTMLEETPDDDVTAQYAKQIHKYCAQQGFLADMLGSGGRGGAGSGFQARDSAGAGGDSDQDAGRFEDDGEGDSQYGDRVRLDEEGGMGQMDNDFDQ